MDAVSVILLILFLIGAALALYYAVICLQSRPKKIKDPSHPDLGPLLANEHDLNGNHEGAPPSTPIDEPDNTINPKVGDEESGTPDLMGDDNPRSKSFAEIEPPLKSVTFQTTPECASKNPHEGSLVLPIDDEPTLSNASKPLMPPLGGNGLGWVQPTQPPKQEIQPHVTIPIPVVVSEAPLQSRSSYEEDGLLVPETTVPTGQGPTRLNDTPVKIRNDNPMQQRAPVSSQSPQKQVQFISTPFVINPSCVVEPGYPHSPDKTVLGSPEQEKSPVFVFGAKPKVGTAKDQGSPLASPLGTKHPFEESIPQPRKKAKLSESEELDVPSTEEERADTTCENKRSNIQEPKVEIKSPVTPVVIGFKVAPDDIVESTEPSIQDNPIPVAENLREPKQAATIKDLEKDWDCDNQDGIEESKQSSSITELEKDWDCDSPSPDIQDQSDDNGTSSPDANKTLEMPCDDPAEKEPMKSTSQTNPPKTTIKVLVTLPTEDREDETIDTPSGGSTEGEEEESSSDSSSDPEVTEYSFHMGGPMPPLTATVLANEVSSYDSDKIGLTHYETTASPTPIQLNPQPIEPKAPPAEAQSYSAHPRPPTPVSDTPITSSPIGSHDTSLDETQPETTANQTQEINPSVLGTPPVTPPQGKISPSLIIVNPNPVEEIQSNEVPNYIVIESHQPEDLAEGDLSRQRLAEGDLSRQRLAEGDLSRQRLSSSSSSTSTMSTSSSDGSYKIDNSVKEDVVPSVPKSIPSKAVPRLKK